MKNKIGVIVPEILLPNQSVNLNKWSVVACDQYTSEPQYWQKVKKIVGSNPSTLNIIFPEVYLEDKDKQGRIKQIQQKMKEYLTKVLVPEKCFVLVDRKTSQVKSRKGLVLALDLENYDYNQGSKTLIRPTEGTVLGRLPPRIAIRKNALIESPHVLILIDDPAKTVIEPLFKQLNKFPKIYDFELMQNGGHIKGYKIVAENIIEQITKSITKLAELKSFNKKYQVKNKKILLFASGDGNHSLATARATWDIVKKKLSPNARKNHPARYALVELINVHDAGIQFEPIHRVLFNTDLSVLLEEMETYFKKQGSQFFYSLGQKKGLPSGQKSNIHSIHFLSGKINGYLQIVKPKFNLEVGTLQSFLDQYLAKHKETKIDYVHGDKIVASLSAKKNNVGFYLPVMNKNDLFKTVILEGALPRKTFSLGEAEEKRFYLECRKIK